MIQVNRNIYIIFSILQNLEYFTIYFQIINFSVRIWLRKPEFYFLIPDIRGGGGRPGGGGQQVENKYFFWIFKL
jgi:hypothetical protein